MSPLSLASQVIAPFSRFTACSGDESVAILSGKCLWYDLWNSAKSSRFQLITFDQFILLALFQISIKDLVINFFVNWLSTCYPFDVSKCSYHCMSDFKASTVVNRFG